MSILRRSCRVFFFAGALAYFLCLTANPQASPPAARKLKVYISVDMEGVAGVVTTDQLGPGGFEYERFRHFMTNETLAAISVLPLQHRHRKQKSPAHPGLPQRRR